MAPTVLWELGAEVIPLAVSPDGSRVVSLEGRTLYVRELPSLRRVRATKLGPGWNQGAVGFLADGREVVFTTYPCTEGACTGPKKSRSCAAPRLR